MSAATATPAKKEEKTGLLATVANNARQYGIVGALLVIVVAFEVLTGGVLLKPNSFVSLIQQNAYVIILAIGMVMVIIATHIDLSVGSLVAFIGGVCALLMERAGVNWMLAIVIALVVGLIVGVWQGFWVAVIGIPGFITTLAGMLIFRGLATVIVGESVPITSLEFRGIARNYLPNILGWWGPFDGLTIVLGILCIVGFAWSQLRKRARVAKVGLVPEPMSLTVLKIVLAAVVIAFVTYLLASSGNADQGGTPIMLVIVGVLVFIYNFILTKTVSVATCTPLVATARPPSSPVSTPAAWTSCCSSTWASCPQWPLSACSPVWLPQLLRPVWSSRWTPSPPASSVARPLPVVLVPSRAL